MRHTTAALLALVLATLTSCTGLMANLVTDKVVHDQLEIEAYRGRFAECHTTVPASVGADVAQWQGECVVKEVQFLAPGKVRIEVVEPADRAGELVVYDGRAISLWWPGEGLGVRVLGAPPPSEPEMKQLIRDDTLWAWKNYHVSFEGQSDIAEQECNIWDSRPRRDAPLLLPYQSWVDDEYAIPLRIAVQDAPDHLWYSMEYQEVAYNDDARLDADAFHFEFPADAYVVEWDLTDPGVPLEEAREQVDFDILLPEDLPEDLELRKVIQGDAGAPMVVVLMDRGGRWLSLTEMSHFGRVLEPGAGIPIQVGDEAGFLNLMGNITSVSWYAGGTALTMMGNFPYPEMVAIATDISGQVAGADDERLLVLDGYRGRTVERVGGRPDEPVVRDVLVQQPGHFRVEVLAPERHAGELFCYDGSTMTLWSPRDGVAVRIHGAEAPTERQFLDVLKADVLWNLRHYEISYLGEETLAGRDSSHWRAIPSRPSPYVLPYEAWLDGRTSIPLKTEVQDDRGAPWFSVEYEEFTPNPDIEEGAFTVELPDDTFVVEWDLSADAIPPLELLERLNFDLLVPDALPDGLEIHKVIGDRSGLPMATLLMDREGRWLSLTETRHFGDPLKSGTGIPIQVGERPGALVLSGGFSTVSWSVGNTALTLIGNLPYPEMIAVAASVAPAPGSADVVDPLSIDSYRGRIVEHHAGSKQRVVSEVVYRAPGLARAEVLEPRSRRGELFLYDGSSVTLWWPRHLFGVRIRGATPPSDEQLRQVLADNALWSLRRFAFTYVGRETVAGREADRWAAEPSAEAPNLHGYETWLDAQSSLPLKVQVPDQPERPWYSMEFQEIAFGEEVDDRTFEFGFPANAVVFEWDLADPGVPVDELQRSMNFDLLLPTALPDGLEVHKIVEGRHQFPMAVVLIGDGVHTLSLTEMRHAGHPLASHTGIPVELGERTGYLNFLGGFSSITWLQGNTALTLIGDVPYAELIAIAASVE